MQTLIPYLAEIDGLLQKSQKDDKGAVYVHPALKQLGCVSTVLLRETIAPVVFRNAEAEITDIDVGDEIHVRAVPNKFKYPERGRGLQLLRAIRVGGRLPQNKTILFKGQKPSDGFDLNTLVFGDSCNHENRVLPVKAAVNYSDALSLLPKHLCVDETFHNRAAEDGTLFDAESKENSVNIFSRHFIKPGTLMVQVLSTRGKVLPLIGFKHLLLCFGLAGAYGGQTSLTGANIRTRVVGIYAGRFEQAMSSPYELVKKLKAQGEDALRDPAETAAAMDKLLAGAHELAIPGATAQGWVEDLVKSFDTNGDIADEYRAAAPKVADLFDQWFGKDDAGAKESGGRRGRGKPAETAPTPQNDGKGDIFQGSGG
jgi:CRISPR-associated protein Csc2